MRPDGFDYHAREISDAIRGLLACANLFKQTGDENIAALLNLLAHHIDENLGAIKSLTLPPNDGEQG